MNETFFDALVVGSGAAGFAAACRLAERGLHTAILTEDVNAGTSRNAGSDKQTYYKLGLAGTPDGVRTMAEDLFACGCTDGDTALAEAALSARCFFRLVELGVPFPCTPSGEYAGYRTDHDPRARASSAGPLTSKMMTEALERQARALGVRIFDRTYVTEILTDENGVCGAAAADPRTGEFRTFGSRNAVLATGGPAGIYGSSVYPESQTGATALALFAGAKLQNLTEWQYGLASVAPRWNVSGSYMQVLPRFYSVDAEGTEREFLPDCFASPAEALAAQFLKGYQWPFDAKKAQTGSSRVDLAVYRETVLRGRTVYLDFTKNPCGAARLSGLPLSDEARDYLSRAGAAGDTPAARLRAMNAPAYELYKNKGVDLETEPLPIALCAQHCNGGIAVDADWRTAVPGLYAVGECAGTHGLSRPGGSALNAGQVGALMASAAIAADPRPAPEASAFEKTASAAEARHAAFLSPLRGGEPNAVALLREARFRFDAVCAAIRNVSAFSAETARIEALLAAFPSAVRIGADAAAAFRLRDTLTVQRAMLAACGDLYNTVGGSRGGAVYADPRDPAAPAPAADPAADRVQELWLEDGRIRTAFRPVRPIPENDLTFETVWRRFRERGEQKNGGR